MTPYEEHCDYEMGRATELQNALALSRMEREPDDTARINLALENKKFVMVEESTDYCSRTDAIMGSSKWLVGVFDTREEAEVSLAAEYEKASPESYLYVLPRETQRPPDYKPLEDGDIPF